MARVADELFPERFTVQLPEGGNGALRLLSRREHRTKADLARHAIIRMLEANGLSLGPFETTDAPHAGAPAMPHAGAGGITDIEGDHHG